MKRGEQIAAAVLIVVLAGYVVWVWRSQNHAYQQAALPTASSMPAAWPVFNSANPPFRVQYPAGWKVLQASLPVIIGNTSSISDRDPSALYLVVDNRPGTSLDSCYQAVGYAKDQYDFSSREVTVGAHQGLLYTINPRPAAIQPAYASAYLFISKGQCFDVALAAMSSAQRNQGKALLARIAASLSY